MNNFLRDMNWKEKLESSDINEVWNKFTGMVNSALDQYIPKVHQGKHRFPAWMNRKARIARKQKTLLWTRYRVSRSYNDWVEYKVASNEATDEYRRAKIMFEENLASNIKSNPKSFYAYVRSKSKTKDRVGPLKDSAGKLVTGDDEMCKMLNESQSLRMKEVSAVKRWKDKCLGIESTLVIFLI